MRVLSDISQLPKSYTYVITIGNFDGLHLGHRSLLWLMKRYAKERHWKTLVISFDLHTQVAKQKKLLYSFQQKQKKLSNIGIDYQLNLDFEKVKKTTYSDFLKWLNRNLHFGMLIASDKFKFGRDRKGSIHLAKSVLEGINPNIEVLAIESKTFDKIPISSTLIRKSITDGDLRSAAKLLGEYYSLEGITTRGDQRGKRIGFPTLNIYPEENKTLPKLGVYFARVTVQNHSFSALSFLGTPSLKNNSNQIVVESHLLNFQKSGYNFRVRVEFIEFYRDNIKVSSLNELKSLIEKDKVKALCFFDSYTYLF